MTTTTRVCGNLFLMYTVCMCVFFFKVKEKHYLYGILCCALNAVFLKAICCLTSLFVEGRSFFFQVNYRCLPFSRNSRVEYLFSYRKRKKSNKQSFCGRFCPMFYHRQRKRRREEEKRTTRDTLLLSQHSVRKKTLTNDKINSVISTSM